MPGPIIIGTPAGGGLSGTYPNPIVSQLQGNLIANIAPQDGDVLTWNAAANRWEPKPAPIQEIQEIMKSPADLEFSKVTTIPYFSVVPTTLRDFNETFTADTGQFTALSENTPGTFVLSGGQVTITNQTAGTARNNIVQEGSVLTMPQVGAQIQVVSRSGTPAGYDNIGVGICKDANNFVWASYDRKAGHLSIQLKIGGVITFNGIVTKALSFPFTLGFSLICQSACVYVDNGAGWEYVTGYSIPTGTYNFRLPANLSGWRAAFTVATPGGNSAWTFDNFQAGRFGGLAARDINIVTLEDGTPYINNNTAYSTATMSDGLGGGYIGVLQWDLTNYTLTLSSVLLGLRAGSAYGDMAAHIIRYSNGDRRIVWGTWGNGIGGVIDTYHSLTNQDILSGSYFLSGSKLNLPGQSAGYGCYDCMLLKEGSTWRAVYTLSTDTTFVNFPFYAAVAYSSDLTTWTAVANDRTNKQYEGTRFIIFEGNIFTASGGFGIARVYDKNLNFRGVLKATMDGGTSAPPHPTVFKHGSKYILLTFDQEKAPGATVFWTWGRIVIHEAPAP